MRYKLVALNEEVRVLDGVSVSIEADNEGAGTRDAGSCEVKAGGGREDGNTRRVTEDGCVAGVRCDCGWAGPRGRAWRTTFAVPCPLAAAIPVVVVGTVCVC